MGEMCLLNSLRTRGLMLAGPAALSGLRLDSKLCTPLTLTVIFGIVGNFLKDEDEIPLRFLKKRET